MTELSFQKGLSRVFEFNGKTCPKIVIKPEKMYDCVLKDGVFVPIFYYKYFNKFVGMKNLDLLGEPCALTVSSFDTEPLQRIIFREIYVAEYLIGSKVEHITAYRNSGNINIIIGFMNKAKAHIQCHSVSCGERQFKHELFTTDGFVSDRVVDTVIAQHALNVYTNDGFETYTDADTMLYGLPIIEQEKIYAVYDIFENKDNKELISDAERIEEIVNLVLKDNKTYTFGEDF